MRRSRQVNLFRLAPLLVSLTACLPRTGELIIEGDGSSDGVGLVDGLSFDGLSREAAPPSDALSDAKTADKTAPGGPVPPFGDTVGMTASDFQNIEDCEGNIHSLHEHFNKKKGVIIAMMSPS